MKKRGTRKIKIHPKYILLLLVICCLVLLFCSYRFPDQMKPVKDAACSVVVPMQKGINIIGKGIFDKLEQLSNINDLLNENAALKEELDQIKYENKMLQQETYELISFRNLYELDQKYIEYPKVAARIISRDSNSFYSTFTIDKGSNDGLSVDMNVLAGNGLVGLIYEVGNSWAKVRPIIDEKSSLSGMFLSTSDTCIVNGSSSYSSTGYIDVEMININADISEHYEVVTSNVSNKYHEGILVGYIVDIQNSSGNLTKEAHLVPVVDFEHLEYVLIITEVKELAE